MSAASWSNLETGFPAGAATQALISRDAGCEAPSTPRLVASGDGDAVVVAIDHDVHVFAARGKEILFSVKLESFVADACWVQIPSSSSSFSSQTNSSLLFLSTVDGQNFIFSPQIKKLVPFHSLSISLGDGAADENSPAGVVDPVVSLHHVACGKNESSTRHALIVATQSARVFVITDIYLADIVAAFLAGDFKTVVGLKAEIKERELSGVGQGWRLRNLAYGEIVGQLVLSVERPAGDAAAASAAAALVIYDLNGFFSSRLSAPEFLPPDLLPLQHPLDCLQWSQCGRYFFALEKGKTTQVDGCESRLLRFCSRTQILLDSLRLVEEEEDEEEEVMEVLLLRQEDAAPLVAIVARGARKSSTDDCCSFSIRVKSLPHLLLQSSTSCSPLTKLLRSSAPKEVVYIEGVNPEEDSFGVLEMTPVIESGANAAPKAIRICDLSSTQPKYYLDSLLRKKKFKEALIWAEEKGLDAELVHETQFLDQLRKLQTFPADRDVDEVFEKVKESLKKVGDIGGIARFCLDLPFSSPVLTLKIFKHLVSRLDQSKDPEADIYRRLTDAARRLQLFLFVGPKAKEILSWKEFVSCESLLHSVVIPLIESNSFDVASRVWRNYVAQIEKDLSQSPNLIINLLTTIPHRIPSFNDFCSWIREAFLPFLATKMTSSLDPVISWALERAESFEIYDAASWPDNAIRLLEGVIGVDTGPTRRSSAPLARAETFLVELKEIKRIEEKYELKLSHAEFIAAEATGDRNLSIASSMLRRVGCARYISSELQRGVLSKFLADASLSRDAVLTEFLKELSAEGCVGSMEETVEETVCVVLGFIQNKALKISALIHGLQIVSLPWNSSLSATVDECLLLDDDPLVESLKRMISVTKLRARLRPYGLDGLLEAATKNPEKAVKRILSSGVDEALDDALFFVEVVGGDFGADRVFVWKMNLWILEEEYDRIGSLLFFLRRSRGAAFAVSIARRLLFISILDAGASNDAARDWKRRHLEAASRAAEFLKEADDDPWEREYYAGLVTEMARLKVALRTGIDVRLSQCSVSSDELFLFLFPTLDVERAIELSFGLGLSLTRALLSLAERSLSSSPNWTTTMSLVDRLARSLVDSSSSLIRADKFFRSLQDFVVGFIRALSSSSSSSTVPFEIRLRLSGLRRMASAVLLRAEGRWLVAFQEIQRRLHLVLDCFDRMGLDDDDENDDDDAESMATILFPEIAKDLGKSVGFELEQELAPALLHYLDRASQLGVFSGSDLDATHEGLFDAAKEILDCLCSSSLSNLALFLLADLESLIESNSSSVETESSCSLKRRHILRSYFARVCRDSVKRLVMSGCVDRLDVVSVLTKMSAEDAEKLLVELAQSAVKSQSFKRLGEIAEICGDLGRLESNPVKVKRAERLRVDARWGYRLSKIGVKDFKDCVNKENYKKIRLLEDLIDNNDDGVDVKLILDFCSDFSPQEKPDFYILKFLGKIVESYLEANNNNKNENNNNNNKGFSRFAGRAEEALSFVTDQRSVFNWAQDQLTRVSPYDYSLLFFLLHAASEAALASGLEKERRKLEKRSLVLDLLKEYVRIGEPSPDELALTTDSCSSSSFASSRLPFHSLFDDESRALILDQELNADTHAFWTTLCGVFGVAPGDVTRVAVANETRRFLTVSGRGAARWTETLTPAETEFLLRLKGLLARAGGNGSALQMMQELLAKIAEGSLKAELLKEVVASVEADVAKTTKIGRERRSVVREESWMEQYRRLATLRILHVSGFASTETNDFADQPQHLFRALYAVQGAKGVRAVEEVDEAVERVAEIWAIEREEVEAWKDSLLEEWIPSVSLSAGDLDQTVSTSILVHQRRINEEEEDEDNLRRAIFLLSARDSVSICVRLKRMYEVADVTHKGSSRILRCVLALVEDEEMLETHFGFSRSSVENRLRSHRHLSVLDQLNFRSTVERFDAKDKHLMAQLILQKFRHDERAVRLARDLCLEYEIPSPALLKDVFKSLVGGGGGDRDLLAATFAAIVRSDKLVQVFISRDLKSIRDSVFQILIHRPLTELAPPLGPDGAQRFVEALNVIHSYPLAFEINIEDLSRRCVRSGFPAGAFVLVSLFASDENEKKRNISNLRRSTPRLEESVDQLRDEIEQAGLSSPDF